MSQYHVDKQLSILKPLKFKKYTNSKRFFANLVIRLTMLFYQPRKEIKQTHYTIRGYNHMKVRVTVFERKHQKDTAPGLLYIHGGGFQMEGTPVHVGMLNNMILASGHKAVFVKYHLSPKFPFPAALMDCYHALLWMKEHAEYLHIDPNDISIAGDSAGGNLATAVALYARDHDGPKIRKQMLLYPVIDVKQDSASMQTYSDTPMWNSVLNKSMWDIYLKNGDFGMLQYASPLSADLHDMPITYIETAHFDCLRDEAIDYARKLEQSGVKVIEYHTRRTVHGYDAVFYSRIVKRMISHRIAFLKGAFE
jgi:acetyl esterase